MKIKLANFLLYFGNKKVLKYLISEEINLKRVVKSKHLSAKNVENILYIENFPKTIFLNPSMVTSFFGKQEHFLDAPYFINHPVNTKEYFKELVENNFRAIQHQIFNSENFFHAALNDAYLYYGFDNDKQRNEQLFLMAKNRKRALKIYAVENSYATVETMKKILALSNMEQFESNLFNNTNSDVVEYFLFNEEMSDKFYKNVPPNLFPVIDTKPYTHKIYEAYCLGLKVFSEKPFMPKSFYEKFIFRKPSQSYKKLVFLKYVLEHFPEEKPFPEEWYYAMYDIDIDKAQKDKLASNFIDKTMHRI